MDIEKDCGVEVKVLHWRPGIEFQSSENFSFKAKIVPHEVIPKKIHVVSKAVEFES